MANHKARYSALLKITLFLLWISTAHAFAGDNTNASDSSSHILRFKQGFIPQVWLSNSGAMGKIVTVGTADSGQIGLEYPPQSQIEHLFGAGLWVGAIVDTGTPGNPQRVRSVSTAYDGHRIGNAFGNFKSSEQFFFTSVDSPDGHNKIRFDDDGDGRADEDELDGVDNDHDGLVDEDYGALSERDVYVAYFDTVGNLNTETSHVPLGIKVWQRSFAWQDRLRTPILPFEFKIINVGSQTLDSVYLGCFLDPDVGLASLPNFQDSNQA